MFHRRQRISPSTVEIESALARNIPVVPVLLGDTPIPPPAELPASIRALLDRQAKRLQRASFDTDTKSLIDGVVRSIKLARGEAEDMPINVDAKIVYDALEGQFRPGAGKTEWFMDHDTGPEMVVVPTGNFMMGSSEAEPERAPNEGPQHGVTIGQPFAIARHAVTRGQFAAFVNNANHVTAGGYVWAGSELKFDPNLSWRAPWFAQDDSHPVMCVSWNDANAYTVWLSETTGKSYRLPSEAEWEYAARAGTTTPFWWGSSITPAQANYDGNYVYTGGGSKGEWRKSTVAVGSFVANAWGLFNVHGNVWEWCEDVWHDTYIGSPTDKEVLQVSV